MERQHNAENVLNRISQSRCQYDRCVDKSHQRPEPAASGKKEGYCERWWALLTPSQGSHTSFESHLEASG